jgi:nucleotide-binding universal stress UspA family protein
MTYLSTQPAPRLTSEAASQEGPVLLATKPLNGSEAPLAVARWLAAREERELHVVTVVQQGDMLAVAAGMPPLPAEYHEAERRTLAAQIRRDLAPLETDAALPRVDVLEGPSARSIVGAARGRGARVIVIGTGRHDKVGRFIYGERALEILSIADRPVLVVPPYARAGPVMVAVVAVDFSPASIRAARAVLPMLSEGSRLKLVHVKRPVGVKEETIGWSDEPHERRIENLFKRFLRQLPSLPGVVVETTVLRGETAPTIIEHAIACDAGLIACGRLGHSFVERVLVGSVSSALVRQATCAVLVAPELPGDAEVL